MFIKQVESNVREKTNLSSNRSLEIKLENGQKITGIVDFVSNCQGAHHVFILTDKATRMTMKIYSNRKLKELIIYKEDSVSVYAISEITVTSKGGQEVLHTDNSKFLYYYEAQPGYKWALVEVGDNFSKAGKLFTVLAITRNGSNMFLEDEKGNGLQVNLNDKTLLDAFSGFKWGTPDK